MAMVEPEHQKTKASHKFNYYLKIIQHDHLKHWLSRNANYIWWYYYLLLKNDNIKYKKRFIRDELVFFRFPVFVRSIKW